MNDISENKISIIMPTYNRGYIIQRAIESIVNQTYRNWELFVVDDGSNDDTKQKVEWFADERIKYIGLNENKGACFARNVGIDQGDGDYFAFLDSDNVWDVRYLEMRLLSLRQYPASVGGCFGDTEIKQDNETIEIFPNLPKGFTVGESDNRKLISCMLYNNVMDTNTVVLSKECVRSIDGFCEHLNRLQDWEYFFRILKDSGYKIEYVKDCYVINYRQEDSISMPQNDSDYWSSRLFFMKQYRDVYEAYQCWDEALWHVYMQIYPDLTACALSEFLNIMDSKEEMIDFLNISRRKLIKHTILLDLYERWMWIKTSGVDIIEGLRSAGYTRIIIYGYGRLGKILHKEISNSGLEVVCVIDKAASSENSCEVPVCEPDAMLPPCDVIIVTVVTEYNEIKKQYNRVQPVISFADMIEKAEKLIM